MPIYVYKCSKCGFEFEKLEKIKARLRGVCPKCSMKAFRVISGGVGLIFKGSGFYCNDYSKTKKENKK